ncbi:MAG TPA: ATP-dependent DNA helicase RecG [Chromatiales bacterium]|nr:ATP-dependent DNA helicase RecG [Chromatiales bacterium]
MTDRIPTDPTIAALKGVGPVLAARLAALGLGTVTDLLLHAPLRYEDRTHISSIGALLPGQTALVEGEILAVEVRNGRKRQHRAVLGDGTGRLTLWFFNPPRGLADMLKRGQRLRAYGTVKGGLVGFDMAHPEITPLPAPLDTALTPIYPSTEGLAQGSLRRLIREALGLWARQPELLPDLLPAGLRDELGLPSLRAALEGLHHPSLHDGPAPSSPLDTPGGSRLVFEELLAQQLAMRRWRARAEQWQAEPLRMRGALAARLTAGLPFRLTGAQLRVLDEIGVDLDRSQPMRRLVQGDVGSGKTVVAALAACAALEAGRQVALMAPTELLAEQHQRNLSLWFEPLGIPVVALTGSQRSAARRQALADVASGAARVVTGTHALFQAGVEFDRLGLIIIDEQHRFGVHQRLALSEKGRAGHLHPHQLVMTATPIPRTLAMTAYADLDVSVLDELPPGRTPVHTAAVPDTRRDEVMDRLGAACRAGRQAYWVCTLIEESEKLEAQAAEAAHLQLSEALPDLRIGLVHGRMKPRDKEEVMQDFKAGRLDILVATTVIEVGVDVPNASLMIIDNAERLGLAQLHQLRGRVGRGAVESSCVLLFSPPLSQVAKERLAVMRETNDGFRIAEKDLELRGPGEFLGTQQTGLARLRFADLARDAELIPKVREVADVILRQYPEIVDPLIERWVGAGISYAKV